MWKTLLPLSIRQKNITAVLILVFFGNAVASNSSEILVLSYSWSKEAMKEQGVDVDFFELSDINPTEAFGQRDQRCRPKASREAGDENDKGSGGKIHWPVSCGVRWVEQFVYRAKIKNSSLKEIRSISWDYIFLEPSTGRELSRHSFRSLENVPSGQVATLAGLSTRPPTEVVTVEMLLRGLNSTYTERVNIVEIDFADGTHWRN